MTTGACVTGSGSLVTGGGAEVTLRSLGGSATVLLVGSAERALGGVVSVLEDALRGDGLVEDSVVGVGDVDGEVTAVVDVPSFVELVMFVLVGGLVLVTPSEESDDVGGSTFADDSTGCSPLWLSVAGWFSPTSCLPEFGAQVAFSGQVSVDRCGVSLCRSVCW